jgi:hypothetical protein
MAVTRLKRKGLRNRAIANNKQADIKRLTQKPEIRRVEIEELKTQFTK